MSTRVTGAAALPRIRAALVLVVLAIAVFVLAFQMSSIWSNGTSSQRQQAPTHMSIGSKPDARDRAHLPYGCRPKYGCQDGGLTAERP
jgi:hypothetical protein